MSGVRDAIARGLDAPRPNALFSDAITNIENALSAAGLDPNDVPRLRAELAAAREALRNAVLTEREACAQVAEKAVWCPCGGPPCQTPPGYGCGVQPANGEEVAVAIRARAALGDPA